MQTWEADISRITLLKHYIDDTKTAVPAYFFRTDVYLNDVSDLEALERKSTYDDAVIVYINGKNVYEGRYRRRL